MDIHFCSQCKNMTYIHIDNDEKLYNVCKVCSHTEEFQDSGSIYNTTTDSIDISELYNSNKYITQDITLPTITDNQNIECTNLKCESHSDDNISKITFIKYDSNDMKYLYI